jgi:hypothetical protein
MTITMIARQAQGIRAGEVIANLAEDAYFMRVDNRVTQEPPLRIREPDNHEATSHSPTNNGRNHTRGELPQNPSRSPVPTVEELLAQMERQPPVAQGSTEPAAATTEEVAAIEAQEEAPAEAGLVDVASILGAPTVMVVRSSL